MLGFNIFVLVLLVLFVAVLAAGVKVVPQGWNYTVERFGRYTRTLRPGLTLIIPFIDRIGRKTLLLVGGAGTAVCLALAALALGGAVPRGLLLPALIGFIAFFAPSQGAVIWVYISEVFPSAVRGRGAALGAGTHWLLNAVIALVFPIAVARLSPAMPFGFFAAMMVVQVIVVARFFPETKGVTLEEIEHRMA